MWNRYSTIILCSVGSGPPRRLAGARQPPAAQTECNCSLCLLNYREVNILAAPRVKRSCGYVKLLKNMNVKLKSSTAAGNTK